jgi:uncharacterized protein YdaU (DUF1376 family)
MSEYHRLRLTRFDFDAADFLSSPDVASMTATEIGQYVLLLCAAWLSGKDATLPNDPKVLAKLARAPRGVSPKVFAKFKACSGDTNLIYNSRLSQEWDAALDRAQRRHEKAQKAAEIMWHRRAQSMPGECPGHSSSNAQAMLKNASESVSESVSEIVKSQKTTLRSTGAGRKRPRIRRSSSSASPQDDPFFGKFWRDYPRQIRLRETRSQWRSLSEPERVEAIEALAAFRTCEQWLRENGRFIPSPDRFLSERRWEHTPPTSERQKGKENARGNSFDPVALAVACGFQKPGASA